MRTRALLARAPLALLVVSTGPFASACGGSSHGSKYPPSLACQYGETAPDDPAPLVEDEQATPGQPTAELVEAMHAYDAGRWLDAIPKLQRVVKGETGDDEGNRQIAEFALAKSFVQIRQYELAIAALDPIARSPAHLKHLEAVLWLAKLLEEPLTAVRAIDLLYLYDDKSLARLDNPEQRETLYLVQYARARAAYRRANYDEALRILERVKTYGPLEHLSAVCTSLASGARRAGGR